MSLDALLWAVKDAPVADVEEHAVLTVLADQADESGCGAFLSTTTIGKRTRLHERTVQRRLDSMLARGLLGLGDQSLASYIRADRRPVVYDLLIPYSAFANVKRVNDARKLADRPPLTPDNRPDIPEPPAPKRRADAGKKRPKKTEPEDTSTTSHPAEHPSETASHPVDGVTTSPTGLPVTDEVTRSPSPTDCKSPDPVLDPVLDPRGTPPPSPTASDGDPASPAREEEDPLPTEEQMTAAGEVLDRVQARANAPAGQWVTGRRRETLPVLAADALRAGWTPGLLEHALSDPLADVKSVYAVLRHRLDALGDPPARPTRPARQQRPARRGEDGRPVAGHTPPEQFAAVSRRGRALVDAALAGRGAR